MRKIILYLLLIAPIMACGQNTVTLPTPTTSYTPQFRYYGAANDTLKNLYLYSGSVYNQIYTATQIAKLFRTPNSIFTRRMDSLFARAVDLYTAQNIGGNKTATGQWTFNGYTTYNSDVVYNAGSGFNGVSFTNGTPLSLYGVGNLSHYVIQNVATSDASTTAGIDIGTGIGGISIIGNDIKDRNGKYFLKSGSGIKDSTYNASIYARKAGENFTGKITAPRVYTGDSTRNITFTVIGSSVTKGPPNGVTYSDSTYLSKYANLQGIKTINYGLSGRAVQQITVGDSSVYSKRFLSPTYTEGSYIGCECLVNDASRDSTVYSVATYTTQLTAWVDAQIAAGYPANHILLFNTAYFNNPAAPTFPNTENRHDQYAAAMQSVATLRGTLFYDGYYTFKPLYLATPSLLDANVLHPTDGGTTIIANALYNYLKTYISTIPENQIQSFIAGSGESYLNFTVGNYLKLKTPPSILPPNSTQPLLGYDATDGRVKTKTLYPSDIYNTIGAVKNTGPLDFNDLANTMPGYAPNILTGSTATNAPTTNSGSYFVYNTEYITRTGLGNLTQLAIPYTTTVSQNNGYWYRARASNVWGTWYHLMASTTLGTSGQIPIIATNGSPYVNTTLTGDVTLSSAGVTAIKSSVSLSGVPTVPTPATNVNTTQSVNGAWVNTFYAPLANPSFTGTANLQGIRLGYKAITSATTFGAGDFGVNVTSGTFTQALPAAPNFGMVYSISNSGTGVVTVTATSMSGLTSVALNQGEGLIVHYTGVSGTYDILSKPYVPSFQNYTASGTGAATTIVVPHGLSGISGTSKVIAQPLNAASAGVTYVTVDATNININYTVAPVTGTNNLSYSVYIKP